MGFEKLEGRARIAMFPDYMMRGTVENRPTEEDALQCARTTGKVEINGG
jgi:hypothetical protein